MKIARFHLKEIAFLLVNLIVSMGFVPNPMSALAHPDSRVRGVRSLVVQVSV